MAASATFALNAELCVRRARLAIVTPDLRHSRRLQAETPLIGLCEFGQPALSSHSPRRAAALHRAGNGCTAIAAILNQEAWRPPKRRDSFNAPMVRRLLATEGVLQPSSRRPRALPERQPDEWTIRELAEELGVPQPTLYNWVQTGRLRSRSVRTGSSSAKLVTADAATIAHLKTIRATPPPWRRLPPPVVQA